jgi:hypothetical protein
MMKTVRELVGARCGYSGSPRVGESDGRVRLSSVREGRVAKLDVG